MRSLQAKCYDNGGLHQIAFEVTFFIIIIIIIISKFYCTFNNVYLAYVLVSFFFFLNDITFVYG
jgi:hypothetical protein